MDEDLNQMSRDQLIAEARKLRAGIRMHCNSSGHELCWHHPALWGLLHYEIDPMLVVPEWPQFSQGLHRLPPLPGRATCSLKKDIRVLSKLVGHPSERSPHIDAASLVCRAGHEAEPSVKLHCDAICRLAAQTDDSCFGGLLANRNKGSFHGLSPVAATLESMVDYEQRDPPMVRRMVRLLPIADQANYRLNVAYGERAKRWVGIIILQELGYGLAADELPLIISDV